MTAKSINPNQVEIIRHYFSRKNPLLGGVCVYASHIKGDSFIKVATAICSPGDQYSKKIGASSARFLSSEIGLPVPEWHNRNKFTRDNLLDAVEHYFGKTLGVSYLDVQEDSLDDYEYDTDVGVW